MYTLQDLQERRSEQERIDFCLMCIAAHKGDPDYRTARIAEDYDRQQNTTICNFQKTLRNLRGQAVPDIFSANYRLPSNFFGQFVTQQNQYLLGNGITISVDNKDRKTGAKEKAKLGKRFDTRLQELGRKALVHKVAFGFWNYDHLEVFSYLDFVPLFDEETGALSAGIRFWQLDNNKPLRFTLYEKDGYTEYIQKKGLNATILKPKRSYQLTVRRSEVGGEEIIDGRNYPSFPIIPLWGNPHHQSEIIGIREKIDCYDLIESGFANDLDDLTSVYWIIHNAGGMEDMDFAKFVERLKTVHAASVDSDAGVGADAHTIQIPYEAREAYLTRLEQDMYKDFQIVNVASINGTSKTATEIMSAYQPMDTKVDMYEYCVLEFLDSLFALVGVEGDATFKRNRIANQTEETQMVVTAAPYIDDVTILNHLPWLTPDEVDDIMMNKANADMDRFMSEVEEVRQEVNSQSGIQNEENK